MSGGGVCHYCKKRDCECSDSVSAQLKKLEETLKPCPLCGGKAISSKPVHSARMDGSISCSKCCLYLDVQHSDNSAEDRKRWLASVALWNNRTNSYTVVFTESWMAGSHYQTITKLKHVAAESPEAARDLFDGTALYVFPGHLESL